jgi:DNA-binding response OmpR family regulator
LSGRQSGDRQRVLFVDDQVDVARTLSGVLSAERYQIQYAADGEEALARVARDDFDLLVVDLRMPPGDWGGLWLLERLSELGGAHPSLVLSGEGGQDETIKALRLGALDFVVKEHAGDELAQRVESCCERAAASRAAATPGRLPRPLAQAMARIGTTKDDDRRLRFALDAIEAAMRFGALAELATRRASGDLQVKDLARLASPSMGAWNDVCRRAARSRDRRSSTWSRIVDTQGAEPLIELRNALVHASFQDRSGIRQGLDQSLRWLDRYLLAVERRTPPAMAVVTGLQYEPPRFRAEIVSLMDVSNASTVQEFVHDAPLQSGHAHLLDAAGPVDLWPYVVVKDGPVFASHDLHLWDGYRSTTPGAAALTDRTRHTNVQTGARTNGLAVLADLLPA